MKKILKKHRLHWSDKMFFQSTLIGLLIFVASIIANNMATMYATRMASSAVQDIFLDNVPVVNVNWIVSDGALLFTLFVAVVLFWEPRKIPFTLRAVALFIFTRSAFITLTHLGPFPERSYLDPTEVFNVFNAGGDFFFSGHTGLPFLIALVFWEDKLVRHVALAVSVLFGVSVLLGHLHYSIDVASAFFITYTIFHLALKFFPQERKLFERQG